MEHAAYSTLYAVDTSLMELHVHFVTTNSGYGPDKGFHGAFVIQKCGWTHNFFSVLVSLAPNLALKITGPDQWNKNFIYPGTNIQIQFSVSINAP